MTLRANVTRSLAALLLSTALAAPLWAQGRTEIRATSGDSVPAPGEDLLIFDNFSIMQINNTGQIAFRAMTRSLTSPTPFASLWLDDSLLVREGFSPPGYNANLDTIDAVRLNNAGAVAYSGTVVPNIFTPTEQRSAIWLDNQLVLRTGDPNPLLPGLGGGGDINSLQLFDLADDGRLLISAGRAGVVQSAGILDPATGQYSAALIADTRTPVSGAATGAFTPNVFGLNAGALDTQGRAAISGFGEPDLPGVSDFNAWAILRTQGSPTAGAQLVVAERLSAPSVLGAVVSLLSPVIGLDASGRVAYSAMLRPGTGGVTSATDRILALGNTTLARTGNIAQGTDGAVFGGLTPGGVAASGTVVAGATLTTGVGDATAANNRGIWLFGPNGDSLLVARSGQSLDGRVINDLFALGATPDLNDYGQVVFRVASGATRQLAVFTPELRWLPSINGGWDNANNWTVGLPPAHVHDVFIDPALSLTVFGPLQEAAVRSLHVGGGGGIATLSLSGGTLTALEGVTLTQNGRLAGDGSLVADVLNRGEVTGNNLRITGTLDSEGRLRGRTASETLIAATSIVNRAGGLIDVRNGEGLTLDGAVESLGDTRVLAGRLESRGSFANKGILFARDATLDFAGGFVNSGAVQLSVGTTDIFGAVENTTAGEIVQSGGGNVTFWDDLRNTGEIRIAVGGRAVIFGSLFGTGSFTGPGTVFLEGTFSPGSSPGIMSFEADFDMSESDGSRIFIGGLERGTEYSGADVGGVLTLGGVLSVDLGDGFLPGDGSVFDLFRADSILGDFDDFRLPDLGGAQWEVLRTATLFSLAVRGDGSPGFPDPGVIPLPAGGWLLVSALGVLALVRRRRPG